MEKRTLTLVHHFDNQETYIEKNVVVESDYFNAPCFYRMTVRGVELTRHFGFDFLFTDYDNTVNIYWPRPWFDGLPYYLDNNEFVKLGLDKHFSIVPREIKYFNQALYSDVYPYEVVEHPSKTVYLIRAMKVQVLSENEYHCYSNPDAPLLKSECIKIKLHTKQVVTAQSVIMRRRSPHIIMTNIFNRRLI